MDMIKPFGLINTNVVLTKWGEAWPDQIFAGPALFSIIIYFKTLRV